MTDSDRLLHHPARRAGGVATKLVLVAAFALLVSACAGPGGLGRRASGEERVAYDAALAHLPGDREAADRALQDLLRSYPGSPLGDDAAEQLARLASEEGRTEDAFRWLYYAVREYPSGDRSDAIRLRLARWERERGASEEARSLLMRVRTNRLSATERETFFRLLADLSEGSIERLGHLAQLRALIQREVDASDEAPESFTATSALGRLEGLDAEIVALLAELSEEQLQRAARALRARPPAARIRLELAKHALLSGDPRAAESFMAEAQRHDMTRADDDYLVTLELRLGVGGAEEFLPTFQDAANIVPPSTRGASGTIGVLLPLSGRFASFGQESLRGVLLAAGIFDRVVPTEPLGPDGVAGESAASETEPQDEGFVLTPQVDELLMDSGVRLVVRDSGGAATQAGAMVRELASDGDVLAIIGPIFSDESEGAASAAERERIPLLTLSNREQIPEDRSFVFRLRTTPEDEVGFLVEYAVNMLGAQKFAVLYPQSRYGRGMRKRFWDAVLERDGLMVAAASYDAGATDFKGPIRNMIGYSLLSPRERVALTERSDLLRRARRLKPEDAAIVRDTVYPMVGPELEVLPPIVDFDALFIPDSYDKIAMIAPQLAFHEIGQVQLLGSSEWNDPDLVKIARRHVRGSVISTPFFMDSSYGFVSSFLTAYRETFERDPDSFSSHGYDAANLVLVQLAAGRNLRTQVRDGVLGTQGYPGVSGVLSMLPDGNARKRPFLVGVRRGRFVGLD